MTTFGPKQVTLVANTPQDVVWGMPDFQTHLGTSIVEIPISVEFTVTNNTSQVCYVSFQYSTLINTYNVKDRKTIAAVPANTTIYVSNTMVPELGALAEDLNGITLTLLSAAAGIVSVVLNVNPAVYGINGGSQQLFGTDDRSIRDYVPFNVSAGPFIPISPLTFAVITVPAGKRVIVDYLYVSVRPTPSNPGDVYVDLFFVQNAITILLARVFSLIDRYNEFYSYPPNMVMDASDQLLINRTSVIPSPTDALFTTRARLIF